MSICSSDFVQLEAIKTARVETRKPPPRLDIEIMQLLCTFLDPESLASFEAVSKLWRDLTKLDLVWKPICLKLPIVIVPNVSCKSLYVEFFFREKCLNNPEVGIKPPRESWQNYYERRLVELHNDRMRHLGRKIDLRISALLVLGVGASIFMVQETRKNRLDELSQPLNAQRSFLSHNITVFVEQCRQTNDFVWCIDIAKKEAARAIAPYQMQYDNLSIIEKRVAYQLTVAEVGRIIFTLCGCFDEIDFQKGLRVFDSFFTVAATTISCVAIESGYPISGTLIAANTALPLLKTVFTRNRVYRVLGTAYSGITSIFAKCRRRPE